MKKMWSAQRRILSQQIATRSVLRQFTCAWPAFCFGEERTKVSAGCSEGLFTMPEWERRKRKIPGRVGYARSGMTLVEVAIALGVLAVGICGVVTGMVSTMTSVDSNRLQKYALNCARQKLAEMQDYVPFNDGKGNGVFFQYGPVPAPGNPASAPYTFRISRPDRPYNANDPTSYMTGTIMFPVNASNNLDETVTFANLGMGSPNTQIDLDGDDPISGSPNLSTNVNTTYVMLPAQITITWYGSAAMMGAQTAGASAQQEVVLVSILANYN